MKLLRWIDRHVAQPGDSETERSQKTLAVSVFFIGAIVTALISTGNYAAGLGEVSILYYALALVLVVGTLCILTFPAHYTFFVLFVLLFSITVDVAVHLTVGSYLSGLIAIQWAILVPVLAVLLINRRLVTLLVLLYVMAMIAAGLLDPMGNIRSAALDPAYVIRDSTINIIFLGLVITGACLYLFNSVERYRQRADKLLLNILPAAIADRLKENPQTIADGYDNVTVLFADIVDFTTLSSAADPVDVARKLNELFSDFDTLAAKHGLEKIKTIGDAYMVAGGLPEPREDHCAAVAGFATDMLLVKEKHRSWQGEPMRIRIGINCGPVVAGVIGQQKFIYDLWGDVVNVASRMESNGLSNEIQVTEAVKDQLDGQYEFEERGAIAIKGKGQMVTYLLRPSAIKSAAQ